MFERELWWMLLVSMAATLPDGIFKTIAVVLTMASLVWVGVGRDGIALGAPPPKKLPEVPTLEPRPLNSPLDGRVRLPPSVATEFKKRESV